MSILLLEKTEKGLRTAVMNRGRLYACQDIQAGGMLLENQVYSGIVERAAKGVHAVFVRLPGKDTGFLQLPAGKKLPASGERVIVQVKRPPTGEKKALLTQDIALAGTHVVFLPFGHGIRLSARIQDANIRASLKQAGEQLAFTEGGLILRSAAISSDADVLRGELSHFQALWQDITLRAKAAAVPGLLWGGADPVSQAIAEETGRLEYVLTNVPEALPANLSRPVRFSEHPFLLHNVEHKLELSLRRTVLLKSGAALVIDPCEAMTVIDVNSGMAAGGKDMAETAEKINLEAVWEIARLLRLRSVGGMILVDFIDMPSEDARARLLDAMRAALVEDPVKTTVHDITVLGLMEITRKRTREPAANIADLPCPHCGGTGAMLMNIEEDAADA